MAEVIGIIYEARPNVTADAIGLCLKSGNAVILKGGSEAIYSNTKIAAVLRAAAEEASIPAGSIQFITSTDHAAVQELIALNGAVDVVIPHRAAAVLIQAVVGNASVPVIETGVGVCHTFVDAGADYGMAEPSSSMPKPSAPRRVQRHGNPALVHKGAVQEFLPHMLQVLKKKPCAS